MDSSQIQDRVRATEPRNRRTHAPRRAGLALALAAAAGCDTPMDWQRIETDRCFPLDGAGSLVTEVMPLQSGPVSVIVDQHGISVTVELMDGSGAASPPATSPVDRVGPVSVIHDASSNEPVSVRIASRDSQDVKGRICLSAYQLLTDNQAAVRAEQALMQAGQAVQVSEWESAFKQYALAARLLDTLGQTDRAALARHAMAQLAYRRLHRENDSHALAANVLARLRRPDPALRGVLVTLYAKALMELPAQDPAAAAATARSRLARARELFLATPEGARELPRLLILEGFLDYQANDATRAYRRFGEAAQACHELGDWQCYAEARQNMGVLAEEQKDYTVALEAFDDALRKLDTRALPELAADITDNLGRLEGKAGLIARSERSRKTATRLYAALGNCDGVRRSIFSLGGLLARVGSLNDAAVYLTQAASLSCPELLELGSAELPMRTAAMPRDQEACTHAADPAGLSQNGKLAVLQALISLNEVLLLGGDIEGASRCVSLAKPYTPTPQSQIQWANAQGTILLARDQPAQARSSFEAALRIADEAGLAPTYEHRGTARLGLVRAALMMRDAVAAREQAAAVLRTSSARADINQLVRSLQALAASYRLANEPGKAIATLRSAIPLIERVPLDELDGEKRALFLATQHDVFAELTDLLIESGPRDEALIWEAFAVAERGRARSLRHAFTQTVGDQGSRGGEPAQEPYRALMSSIRDVANRETADGSHEHIVQAIAELAPPSGTGGEDIEPARLLQLLREMRATLIEYAVGRDDLYAFVIDPDGPQVVRLGNRDAISQSAARLNAQLRNPEARASQVRNAARELAQLVLWPVSQHVQRNRLIIAADDALHTVPFAVLPWSAENPEMLVVHRAETALVPSAALFARHGTQTTDHPLRRVALIGDPVFREGDWQRACSEARMTATGDQLRKVAAIPEWAQYLRRLPGTRTELLALARQLRQTHPESRVDMYLDCAATPRALRTAAASGSALLHVATHGRIDAQRPRLSALALTPDPATGDGMAFSLLDILNLRLQARLVVLSACDTSQGRLLPGEGVLGLAQAFLQAGAASVLASHWRVEDEATSAFMQRFYGYLLRGHTASAALRQAQMDEAEAGGSFHWAAFSLYGWPDSSL